MPNDAVCKLKIFSESSCVHFADVIHIYTMRQKRALGGTNLSPRGTKVYAAYTVRVEPELLAELREISDLAGYPWRVSAIIKHCVKLGLPAFRQMITNGGLVPHMPAANGTKKVA